MARDNSFDERRRQRELEDEADKAAQELRKSGTAISGRSGSPVGRTGDVAIDKLLECFQRAEPLIEQLNNLYNQYIAGVESRPPLERRKQLDQLMVTLQGLGKPTPAYQFKYTTLNSSYLTHRDRWDKLIKDLESGKIKRVAGPRNGRTG